MRTFLLTIIFLSMSSLTISKAAADNTRTIVYVLFDGLAPAMIEAANTPNLDRIQQEGSWTHDMKPVFPTVSAVNHTSYTTGCMPGDHGIVSNFFYDTEQSMPGHSYYEGSRDADWRLGCETMWEVAEKSGKTAAALGFTGHYSTTRGTTATHAPLELSWKQSPDDPERTNQVIELITASADNRASVIAAYYKGPDWVGHWKGTTAPETITATEAADAEVGRLMAAIEALDPAEEVVLFVAADHSMVDVETYFNIGRVMYKHDIAGRYASDGAHAFIYLDDEASADDVVLALKSYDMLSVYRWPHYPDYFPTGDSRRSGDILIVLDQPYWIADPSEFPAWASWLGLTVFWPETLSLSAGIKASHGYPPHDTNMGTSFYAWGKGIQAGKRLSNFDIIDAAPSALFWLGLPKGEKSTGDVRRELFDSKKPGFSAPVQNVASQIVPR